MWTHANAGVMCPISMTYSAVPALRVDPEIAGRVGAAAAAGALCGMAMTEKQGGSDVRANVTRAEPVGDGWYELHGHKWFCSYPPCDDLPGAGAGRLPASRASWSSAARGWSSSA